LGQKTEFGNRAMAVLANDILDIGACKPATWIEFYETEPTRSK
jgi:hypothetical protein